MKTSAIAIALILAAFSLFFFRLGDRALWSSDEGRYAEIPREMLERSDVVSPYLNGVRYFEKPPLVYWLTAANFYCFGQTEGCARFWPAFLGACGITMTWYFARLWFGLSAGLWAAWFLLTSIGYFLVGRYLVLDMPFTFFLCAGLFCFLEGFEKNSKRFLIGAYCLWGLATLVKGVIACVFPALIIGVYLTWTRQWVRWRDTGVLWGGALWAAIVLPWFVLICRANPSFFHFFFVHEHLQRFITHEAGRPGPIYYFFGIGMAFFLPWSLFVFFLGERISSLRAPIRVEDRKRLFLGIWILAIFLFFSISRSKLPPYILPILPPLAILAGYWVKDFFQRKDGRYQKIVPALFAIAFWAVLVGSIVLLVFLHSTHKPEKVWLEPYILVVTALFLMGSGAAFVLARRPQKAQYAFIAWGLAIILSYPAVVLGMERLDPLQSSKELSVFLKRILKPSDILAIYGGFEDFSDIPFYLRRRVMIVGTNIGELTYGSRIGDQKPWFLSVDEFRDYLKKAQQEGKNVYCLAYPNEYNELQDKGIRNMSVLFRTPKAYVLMNKEVH